MHLQVIFREEHGPPARGTTCSCKPTHTYTHAHAHKHSDDEEPTPKHTMAQTGLDERLSVSSVQRPVEQNQKDMVQAPSRGTQTEAEGTGQTPLTEYVVPPVTYLHYRREGPTQL